MRPPGPDPSKLAKSTPRSLAIRRATRRRLRSTVSALKLPGRHWIAASSAGGAVGGTARRGRFSDRRRWRSPAATGPAADAPSPSTVDPRDRRSDRQRLALLQPGSPSASQPRRFHRPCSPCPSRSPPARRPRRHRSPTCFSHCRIVPSSIESDSLGITTSAIRSIPPGRQRRLHHVLLMGNRRLLQALASRACARRRRSPAAPARRGGRRPAR